MPNATLNSFSDLTQGKASQIRNCANEPDMRAWFEALFLEKFDGQDERAQKAWAWCSTVGRKHMLREGAFLAFNPGQSALAAAKKWIRDAIEAGKPLTALTLEPAERELFSSILDWMRSPSGPSLNSDWSKISLPQAKAAELAWIDAITKAAAKKDLEAADAAGTEIFVALGPGCECSAPEWAGWRWVEVKSADALGREGAMMKHCVGSYAADVASGDVRIFSLRDPSNAPRLTVEAQGAALTQMKAFANAPCPAELRSAIAAFSKAFEADAQARGLGEASVSEDIERLGLIFLPGLGFVDGELSAIQAEKLRRLVSEASAGSEDAARLVQRFAPGLAGLGLAKDLATILHLSTAQGLLEALRAAARSGHIDCVKQLIPIVDPEAGDSYALRWAAHRGHADCVKILIPVSDPMADNSVALRWAANNGHAECVKLLIPVSAPNAADSQALGWASLHGYADCVKLLIPVSDPKADGSVALRWAAERGDAECVKLLIPVSDPKANNSRALREAAFNGHMGCVKLLLPVSDPLGREDNGLTAQELALRDKHPDVAAMIGRFMEDQTEAKALPAARAAPPRSNP